MSSTVLTPDSFDHTADGPRRVRVIRAPQLSWRGLMAQLRLLAEYRDLLYTLTLHRIRVRYKQSLLGISWALLQPFSLMLIYTVIFSLFARMPSEGAPYAVFTYAALLLWTYLSTAVGNATNGLVSHAQLVTRVWFPREILPITYVLAALFDFTLAAVLLGGLMLYFGVQVTVNALLAVPIIVVLTIFITALALILSATQVRFRDIGVAVPLLLQLWMFASPVIYPLSVVPARFRTIYLLNPMAGFIENFRRVVLQGQSPDWLLLGFPALISVALFAAGYIYFKRVEATMADII
ncbi:MAG TPA: ABC transporter permease [Blastocatellia bacterium]|nr:ABC transporter permease [Blastocatellia bacterium]